MNIFANIIGDIAKFIFGAGFWIGVILVAIAAVGVWAITRLFSRQ